MTPLTPEQVAALNPGIRSTVLKLREWGFDTIDSGDGVTRDHGCDPGVPYVHVKVARQQDLVPETRRLYMMLIDKGISFDPSPDMPHPQDDPEAWAKHPAIEASYSPVDGHAFITITNVILP